MQQSNYWVTGEHCPKCGDHMIINRRYEECSAMRCDYIKKDNLKSAEISDCETYRYVLKRKLNTPLRWVKPCLFIMLNPSTADAVKDDPTIRRCISFAEREGCTELTVINLFALRATNPKALECHFSPIGPENDLRISEEVAKATNGIVVAAWGANKFARDRALRVIRSFGPFLCLGKNKDGSPKHPLYVKADQPLVEL